MTIQLPLNVPQYLFDEELIAAQSGVTRRWLPAAVYPDPVLRPDKPWEGRGLLLYGSVLPDPAGGYRMYYSNFRPPPPEWESLMMLATSRDGFTWEKPELGVVEYNGSRANNILLRPDRPIDSPAVIHDPADAAFPYKLTCNLGPPPPNPDWGTYGYRSRDGLRWEPAPDCYTRLGDRNSLYRDSRSGKYVLLTRDPDAFQEAGGRHLSRAESDDFVHWSKPELVLSPKMHRETEVEYYGMPVFERHGWYFGLLEYWNHVRDVIEVHLVVSRDGKHWSPPQREQPFIAATYPWNRAWSTCANNGPLIIQEQMVFYFGGRWVAHNWDTARQHGVIGFASLPLDRFCALEGDAGWVRTVPLEWPGGDLVVNADTRPSFESHPAYYGDSELHAEVLDAAGEPLPGWSGAEAAVFQGNTLRRGGVLPGDVRWPGDRGLDTFRGRMICLRLHLRHARLFTLAARTHETTGQINS